MVGLMSRQNLSVPKFCCSTGQPRMTDGARRSNSLGERFVNQSRLSYWLEKACDAGIQV